MEMPPSLDTTVPLPGRAWRQLKKAKKTGSRAAYVVKTRVEVRTDGGWTIYVPAPIALIGLVSLLLVGILAAFDPQEIRAAVLDRQADQLQRWEARELAKREKAAESLEAPLRDLRRQALTRGIAPEGALEPTPCSGDPEKHFEAHAREAAALASALAAKSAAAGYGDAMLPSRSPIDLAGGDYDLADDRWMPESVYVSSRKGGRSDPFTGEWKQHKGLDISAPTGTPVVAAGDGKVIFAGSVDPNVDHFRSMMGNYVVIEHGKTGYTTIYAHLSKIDVKAGQAVKTGEKIGAVGTSGRSTAPHLHYQVMKGDAAVDPLRFIADVVLVRDGKSIRYVRPKTALAGGAR